MCFDIELFIRYIHCKHWPQSCVLPFTSITVTCKMVKAGKGVCILLCLKAYDVLMCTCDSRENEDEAWFQRFGLSSGEPSVARGEYCWVGSGRRACQPRMLGCDGIPKSSQVSVVKLHIHSHLRGLFLAHNLSPYGLTGKSGGAVVWSEQYFHGIQGVFSGHNMG